MFSDVTLSRRLEQAEGKACAEFAAARRRLFPASSAEWMTCGGAYTVFDGVDSPVTQTFGLGIFEELTPEILEAIEKFFSDRGAPVFHEVSPFAGIDALNLLCDRGYRPVELSNVMVRPLGEAQLRGSDGAHDSEPRIEARVTSASEAPLWSDVSVRGWTHEHPDLREFLLEMGTISAARENSVCFLASLDGKPGAAAGLSIHDGVALLAGSATVPELRRQGLHSALLHDRLRYAAGHGCDLAMIAVQPGSHSQRNAERNGFHIAYTRTKWKL